MKTKIKFLNIVVKNEDSKYDGYFKVVFTCKVIMNDQNLDFKYTEEDGMGVTLEIKENETYKKVNSYDKFEYLLLDALFSQSPIDFDSISESQEIELIFDYYEEDGLIEF
jgi:hypothetical protein